jgi:hypothetical protein
MRLRSKHCFFSIFFSVSRSNNSTGQSKTQSSRRFHPFHSTPFHLPTFLASQHKALRNHAS